MINTQNGNYVVRKLFAKNIFILQCGKTITGGHEKIKVVFDHFKK